MGPRGSGPRPAPQPPPPRGGPATATERTRRGGVRRRQEGGQGREPRAAPKRESREAAARPPPHPPRRAASLRGAGPHHPRQGGWSPLPPPERGAGARPAPRPSRRLPQEPRGTSEPTPTRQDAAQIAPREGGRARTGVVWGPGPHDQNDASDTRFVACPGKTEGRNEAERPPAVLAPPAAQTGGTAHGLPPPPPRTRPPAQERHRPAPRGAHSPKPGRGEPGPDRPPPKHARRSEGPGQDTQRGTDHFEGPYQRPLPGLREVRTPHHPGAGGADAAGARAQTHAKGTRGLPEGQPDRARGTHRPPGMAYQ